MSATMQPPPGNVVPIRPPGMGMPAPGGGPPPGMMPNPAFAQWQQANAKVQQITTLNQAKQKQFDDAVALIRKDGVHGFRLDVEADSTIAPDEQAEKQARIEFLQQMVPMLENVIPLAQGNPPLATLAKEMALFAARGFRVARPLEESLEAAFDAIAQMPPNPKVSGQGQQKGAAQNPAVEQAKVQADMHDTDQKAQTERMAIAQKQQQSQAELAIQQQRDQAEDQKTQAELALSAAELQQRERLSQARVTAIGAREAGMLG